MIPEDPTVRPDHDILIKLDQKFDSYIAENRQINTDITSRFADHESRIRTVEGRVQGFQGALKVIAWLSGILGALSGSIVALVTNLLVGKH